METGGNQFFEATSNHFCLKEHSNSVNLEARASQISPQYMSACCSIIKDFFKLRFLFEFLSFCRIDVCFVISFTFHENLQMSLLWSVDNENVKEFPIAMAVSAEQFDPLTDAKALRAAMKGFGVDEQVIINILCQRSSLQRQTICEFYHRTFSRDLVADLKSELSCNFKDLIVGLMMPTDMYCAKQVHKALKNKSHDVLVEILCSRPYYEIEKIATSYESMYSTSLANDIKKETSGSFQLLLSTILQRMKDQSSGYGDYAYDPDKAKLQALVIFKTVKEKFRTNEKDFFDIFGYATQRRRQTSLVFQEYQQFFNKSIMDTLQSETSGVLRNSLSTIVKSLSNRPIYFAERLHLAMKGLGTDDDALIRIIVSRCEIDLVNIIFEYERIYDKTLFSAVKEETSGYYRRSLLTILGMEPSDKSSLSSLNCSWSSENHPWYQSQQSLSWNIRETIRKFQK